jgi:hypothetical protein
MAVSYTVTKAGSGLGPFRFAHGTFTSANGDGNGESITASTHGLNYIVQCFIALDGTAMGHQSPEISISSGTITWTVEDTLGFSGRWFVMGL